MVTPCLKILFVVMSENCALVVKLWKLVRRAHGDDGFFDGVLGF
jgi:hypothetical protein